MKKAITILICLILIILAGWHFLLQENQEVLFMAQMKSLFCNDEEFFNQCMQKPGGLLQWAGCWFTQLFYNTWIGVTALIAIWCVTFLLILKAYGLKYQYAFLALIPIACLLISDIDLGYWLYYSKHPGYYFRESLGVLCVAVLLTLQRLSGISFISNSKTATLVFDVSLALVVALLYPFIGYYALVTLLCLIIRTALSRRWIGSSVALLLLIATPLIALQYYSNIRSEEAFYAGFPLFRENDYTAYHLAYPFFVCIAVLLLLHFVPKKANNIVCVIAGCVTAVLLGLIIDKQNFDNVNYHKECLVYRAADQQNWDELLDVARSIQGPSTREIIILKNIALMHKGTIGNEMFQYDNGGTAPYVNDSLQVHLVEIAAPLIYLHHGKTNFAIRWAIENSVEVGMSVDVAKVLVQCALINGEKELALKHLDTLSKTMYYKDWADFYRKVAEGKTPLKKCAGFGKIAELHYRAGNQADTDNGLCEKYLLDYFSKTINKDSRYLSEVTLVYSLITQDIQTFWQHFFPYAILHQDIEMPIHYQEAAYLYGVLEPQSMDTSGMPFDEERIRKRYASFNETTQAMATSGLPVDEIGRRTESQFGDTFWWFYYFCRNKQYY